MFVVIHCVVFFFFFFFFLLNAHRYVYRSLDIGNVLIVDISSHFFAYTNLDGSNTDGSFTVDDSNTFLSP